MAAKKNGIVLAPPESPFIDWATAFQQYHGFPKVVQLKAGGSDALRAQAIKAIWEMPTDLDVIAFFSHGWLFGLGSAGMGQKDIPTLGQVIRDNAVENVIVLLYACGTGAPGGFAERLQKAIGMKSVVYGHEQNTLANVNPYKRRYPGGKYVISINDPLWCKWVQAILKDYFKDPKKNNLWMRFSFLTDEELRDELEGNTTPARVSVTTEYPHATKWYKCKP